LFPFVPLFSFLSYGLTVFKGFKTTDFSFGLATLRKLSLSFIGDCSLTSSTNSTSERFLKIGSQISRFKSSKDSL
jgi:hypothetical protein